MPDADKLVNSAQMQYGI